MNNIVDWFADTWRKEKDWVFGEYNVCVCINVSNNILNTINVNIKMPPNILKIMFFRFFLNDKTKIGNCFFF